MDGTEGGGGNGRMEGGLQENGDNEREPKLREFNPFPSILSQVWLGDYIAFMES